MRYFLYGLLISVSLYWVADALAVDNAEVVIQNKYQGSGNPALNEGYTPSTQVYPDADVYHEPQYMPGHPTAATLYPRIIDVPCKRVSNQVRCDGYNWKPAYGRGEYLHFRPVVTEVPTIVEPPEILVPVTE